MSRDTLSALVAVHEPALHDEIGSELAADGFDVHRAARGLRSGADDCHSRPIAGRELAARLRVIARRPDGGRRTEAGRERSYADIRLDREAERAWRGERDLELTATEFVLLDVLVARAGLVVGRSEIHTEVWGYDFGSSSNSLAVYVGYLRRKLEEPGRPRLLHTVRGLVCTLSAHPHTRTPLSPPSPAGVDVEPEARGRG